MLKLHKIALLNIILSLGACGMPYASQLAEDNSADQAALLDIFTMQGSSNTSGQGASFRYENRLEFHLLSENHQFLRKLIGQKIFVSIDYFFPTNLPEFYDDKSSEELFEQHVRGKLDQLLAQQYDHFILTTLPDLNVLHFTLKEKAMNEARFLPLKAIQAAVSNNDIRRRKLLIVNLILEEVGQARSDRLSVVSLNKTFVSPVLENNFHDDHLTSNLRSAFAQDLVHFNDAGQALIFNLSLKKAIENLVPGERISPMKLNGAPAWQQELSLMFYSKNSLGFVGSQNNGTFLVQISDKRQLSSAKARQEIAPQLNSNLAIEARKSINTVQYVISAGMSQKNPPPTEIKLRTLNDGRKVVTIDFDKIFKYALTDLVETAPGSNAFTAYGSDYFTSAVAGSVSQYLGGFDPSKLLNYTPHYWYAFEAKANPTNPKALQIRWLLIPPFTGSQGAAIIPPEKQRLSAITEKQILNDLISISRGQLAAPYLEYNLELQMRD